VVERGDGGWDWAWKGIAGSQAGIEGFRVVATGAGGWD